MPLTSSEWKHAVHVFCFVAYLLVFELSTGGIRFWALPRDSVDPWTEYGFWLTTVLYALRWASLLALPQCLFNHAGLTVYNAFKDKVHLRNTPLLAPFVCVRVVTRGDYPELVRQNVQRNVETCRRAGMENFMVEVVSDKPIDLPKEQRLRLIVVPPSYRTKSGALFKARALQYCLEDDVNMLDDEDWIVHLDEETLISENAVCGILNFCSDGAHKFGQGVITYAHGPVVNWLTTLADSFRVADDMGKLRFQLRFFHKPFFGWKGSYVVTQVRAERSVSFDHGRDGSVAEDCFFSMVAYRDGHSFDFIEGEMYEKSPFTIWDFLQQRKRWLQGIFLVVHSRSLPWRVKTLLALMFYAWLTLPGTLCNVLLAPFFPLPCNGVLDACVAYVGAVNTYMYMLGAVKSFGHVYRRQWRLAGCVLGALLVTPLNALIESAAVLWGICGAKHQFYVVRKESLPFTV